MENGDKSVREVIIDFSKTLSKGQWVHRQDIFDWINQHRPDVKYNAKLNTLASLTINSKSRRRDRAKIKPDSGKDIFYQHKNEFRLYDPVTDSESAIYYEKDDAVNDEDISDDVIAVDDVNIEIIDFDPHDKEDWPRLPGVYILKNIRWCCYVGSSGGQIRARLLDHCDRHWYVSRETTSKGRLIVIRDDATRLVVEQLLINELKPLYNKQHVMKDDE